MIAGRVLLASALLLGAARAAPVEVPVVGYNDMKEMLEPLARSFEASHPEVHVKLSLPGTRFAPTALAKGESAFAPMGAEFTPAQLAEYRALQPRDPIEIRVAHASLDPRALSGPLAVFVNAENPLQSLTLDQVARAFAGEARTWGDLGATGEWAKRPVKTIGLSGGTALSYAFIAGAMGARKISASLAGYPQSTDVAREVGRDPAAIGFAAAMRATAAARALAIAPRAGAEPVALTEANITAGRYPLDRFLLVYLPHPVTTIARDFVRLMLSGEGQRAVAATPQRYLPLNAAEVAAELAKIDDPDPWALEGRPLPPRESEVVDLDPALLPYRPCGIQGGVEGSVPAILPEPAERWKRAFEAIEPAARVGMPPPYREPQAKGSPRLRMFIDGKIDFALLTREMAESDLAAFRLAHGFDPLRVPVSGGSFRHFGFVDSVAVIVHRDNPVEGMTLAQLDAVVSKSRLRGHPPVATWGDLGVAAWADRPVHVVGSGAWAGEESARATFIREHVMDSRGRRGEWRDADPKNGGDAIVVDAVAGDPGAIGFTAMGHLIPGIRVLPIATGAKGPFVEASFANVASAEYPLSRVIYMYVARRPGEALSPALDAFVRFLLSRDGQRVVMEQGTFLPLRAEQVARALALLPASNHCSLASSSSASAAVSGK